MNNLDVIHHNQIRDAVVKTTGLDEPAVRATLSRVEFYADEWDDGWFYGPAATAYFAPGRPLDVDFGDDVEVGAMLDRLSAEARASHGLRRGWRLVVDMENLTVDHVYQ